MQCFHDTTEQRMTDINKITDNSIYTLMAYALKGQRPK